MEHFLETLAGGLIAFMTAHYLWFRQVEQRIRESARDQTAAIEKLAIQQSHSLNLERQKWRFEVYRECHEALNRLSTFRFRSDWKDIHLIQTSIGAPKLIGGLDVRQAVEALRNPMVAHVQHRIDLGDDGTESPDDPIWMQFKTHRDLLVEAMYRELLPLSEEAPPTT